ncbi:MAG: chemotaxis protein CheW [Pseudomonadota bacterium]
MNMTAESFANTTPDNMNMDGLRAFTFWILETLYAVDIAKVLTISQELNKIQSMPAKGKGLLGMIEFHGHAIPVIDFASMLNMKSATQRGNELIQLLTEREHDHHEWLNALENSIINGDPFLKAKDPNQCAFGIWRLNFTSRDETLMDILSDFDQPHKQIHKLADKLLNMRITGDIEGALKILNMERDITMRRMSKHFAHAREHVRESSRAVLLYITEDGTTPTLALKIDDIHDVIDFKAEQFKSMSTLKSILGHDESKLISSYIKLEDTADCLLIDTTSISGIIKEV